MKSGIVLGLLATGVLVANAARADDKTACLDASAKGQRLRATHKLVEAREQLRACAAAQCPGVVQSDCASWLADVEKALPTVVVTAKDGAGGDLADVKVTVDGQPLVTTLDGQAMPMNAGPHAFHFERGDGTSVDRQVIVREGEKSQSVSVVLGAAPVATPAVATSSSSSSTWKTVGWVLGGVGIVGLGVGTAFGVSAMGDKSSADCNASNQCQSGPLSSAKSAATAADVGLVAGGVLLAGGVALVLFAPSGGSEKEKSAGGVKSVKVGPMVGAGSGGVVVGGSW